jgi:phage gp29-like protein
MYVTERPIVDYSPRTVTRYSSFLDSFREYLTDGLTAERLATLWKDIDQGEVGDLIELNEEMEAKDAHLQGVANTRRQAITALEWTVEPRDDSPEAAEAAEWVESELQGVRTFRQSLKHLATAIGPGLAVVELVWRGGRLVNTLDVPGHRLMGAPWMTDGLFIEVEQDQVVGVEAVPGKFVVFTPQTRAGFPIKVTITRAQAKLFLLKHYALADWAGFLEKFGKPWPIAKVDTGGTPNEATKVKEYLRDMMADGFGVFSPNVEIELKEAARSTEPYSAFMEKLESKQSILYLGQTLTTENQNVGSWALGRVHDNIRATILVDDIDNESEVVENQIIRHMVRLKWPARETPVPKFKRRIIESRNLDEERVTMEKVRLLRELQQPIDPVWLYDALGVPIPEGTPTAPIGLAGPGDNQSLQPAVPDASGIGPMTGPT